MGQRQRIRSSTVENEKHFAVLLKNLAYALDDAPSPKIIAVGYLGVDIRFRESVPRRRTNAGGVIAGKVVTVHRLSHRRFQ